jgi:signal transduction histidine kinase
VLDWTAAAVCAVIIFGVLMHAAGPHPGFGVGRGVAAWPLVLLIALGLAFPVTIRRRAPLRALAIVLAGCVVLLVLGASLTAGPTVPLCLVLYVVATTCRWPVAMAGLAGALALLVVQGIISHFTGIGPGDSVGAALVLVIVWTVGYAVQQRRTYLAHLRDRAASDAVTRERLRIARELHDVVAHSMTVVTVQAGFGEYVFDSQPAEARAALGAIQAVGREALGEMQRLLCVLRQPETDTAVGAPAAPDGAVTGPAAAAATAEAAEHGPDHDTGPARGRRPRAAAPLAPAPGLASLGRLVQRTAGAGVTVTVERTGSVRALPAGLDLSAFRIVQEALTNVVKHSGADRCQVWLDYRPSDLLIEVTDHGAAAPVAVGTAAGAGVATMNGVPVKAALAAGSGPIGTRPIGGAQRAGHGIVGMRERVSLCGGQFSAAPRPGGGFVVRARLPLDSRS